MFAVVSVTAVVLAVLALRPLPEGIPVVVAKEDLVAREAVGRSSVRVIAVPAEASPRGALTAIDEVVGQVPSLPIPAGTVLTGALVGVGEGASRIPQGYAQVVVAVSRATAFVAAGDQIEVWGMGGSCVEEPCALARLAQNVEVVAVTESGGGFASESLVAVALVLPSSQVGAVLQSAEAGNIHFVLR